jgi:hypothetical protein
VATVAVLLDMFPAPSTDGVGEVYQWLKNNLRTIAAQQAESSLQHRDEATILTPIYSKDRGQTVTQGALEVRMASSPMWISAYDRFSRLGARSEPQVHQWHCLGDDNMQSQ